MILSDLPLTQESSYVNVMMILKEKYQTNLISENNSEKFKLRILMKSLGLELNKNMFSLMLKLYNLTNGNPWKIQAVVHKALIIVVLEATKLLEEKSLKNTW